MRATTTARIPAQRQTAASLTAGAAGATTCPGCGRPRLMQIAMTLTDGSVVDFASCHACEHRTWTARDGRELSIGSVLAKAQKIK